MEKICEFCTAFRAVVYCKADAARLCLSCDTKVHSANALSSRHVRTLLCDSCRDRPAYIRCLTHQMFFCHRCDHSLHDVNSQHQKHAIRCYTGCPSPKDFVRMWGFQMKESDHNNATRDRSACSSSSTVESRGDHLAISITSRVSCPSSVSGEESELGSSNQTQIFQDGKQQHNSSILFQQILELKRLHLTEENKHSPVIRGKEKTITSSTEKLDKNLDQDQGSPNLNTNQFVDPLLLPFSEMENAPLSPGESFWQCKSPVQSSQLWSQNMQDLGMCEEIPCNDEFDIPEVDLTFRNFEELFGGDQDPNRSLPGDEYLPCPTEKDVSFENSGGNDNYMASTFQTIPSHNENNTKPLDDFNKDSLHPIQPHCSTLSSSFSKSSADSSGTDCFNSRLSPLTGEEASIDSPEVECVNSEARGNNAMMRYKEKKKARLHENQIRYTSRRSKDGIRKQVRERFIKPEDHNSDASDIA